jgi:hypothetical protein
VTKTTGGFAWFLKDPRRAKELVKPKDHPQPSFFEPF